MADEHNDPPSNWANARPLGGDVYWLPLTSDGKQVALVWHWCTARGPSWSAARTLDHQHLSFDPLHIEPSLLCAECGWHGFIRNGEWASV